MLKKILVTLLIIFLLSITSCNRGYTPEDPKRETYYQGSEGVRMYVEPGSPPNRLYYYSDGPTGEDNYNTFDVSVELQNVGASWTKGGIYVSGYDPSLIHLTGINIPKTGGGIFDNCALDFGFTGPISWNNIFGVVGCNFEEWGFSGNQQSFGVNNLLQLFGCTDCPEVDFNYDWETGQFNVDLSSFSFDFLHHGRGLLMLLDALRFDRFNGKQFILAPDDYNFPGGESTIISFPGEITQFPKGLDYTDISFLFTTCYAYATYATPVVCIDPDPYTQNQKACYPGKIDLKGSQGAPVAITRVDQENTPKSVIFTIYIQNIGNGKVINPFHLELCSPFYPGRLGVKDLDVVFLGDIRMSGSTQRLRCTPDNNVVRLRDGRGQITCTYDIEYATAKSAYTAPLLVELWYGYSESQLRNVRIKRAS